MSEENVAESASEESIEEEAVEEEEDESKIMERLIDDYLDTLNDERLYEVVNALETETLYLPLENEIFENFLLINEPTIITGMENILETAIKLKTRCLYTITSIGSDTSLLSGSISVEKNERINLSQKTDLVLREVEELQKNLIKFTTKTKQRKITLTAELEEIRIEQMEVNDAIKNFESTVVIEGVEQLTGRIPAEKFIKYMHDWLKNQQFMVEKMRLRLATTKDKHNKIRIILAQKEEVGESLREVDFEKIMIENQNYIEQIEQKNVHLIELKKMAGRANLVLSTHKKYLLAEVEQLKKFRNDIEVTRSQSADLLNENELVMVQVNAEQKKYERIKQYVEDYRAPDVLDYIKLKNILNDIKREVKSATRKNKLLVIALHSQLKAIKKVMGVKEIRPEWLLPYGQKSTGSFDSIESFSSLSDKVSQESQDSIVMSYINVDFSEVIH